MTFMDWLTLIVIVYAVIFGNLIYDIIKWALKDCIKWIRGDK